MRRSRLIAGALAAAAVAVPAGVGAAPAVADDDVGGATTVVLNPELVPVLVDTLKVAPIAPGTLTTDGGVAQLAFPITEVDDGVVSHKGGLSLQPVGGGDLAITNFDINTGEGVLTAEAALNGTKLEGRVPVFRLGAVQPINGATPRCDGTAAGLTLTPEAAQALNAPSFGGAFVGDACVKPVFEDDDDRDDEDDDRDDDDRDDDDRDDDDRDDD
jgi:hypothetical protein